MNWQIVEEIIIKALKEDNVYRDITTDSIVDESSKCKVDVISKEQGIVAGIKVFKKVFIIMGDCQIDLKVKDGERVEKNQIIAEVKGRTSNVLKGERVALNILQHMSGIATFSNKMVNQLKGTKTKLLDTRKTLPNFRILEKYAVMEGGAYNHRFSLSDGVLIKDNHIKAAGSITRAIELVRRKVPFLRKIEVEVETKQQVYEAVEESADIIMLDNMDVETMADMVNFIGGRAIVEASGNVTLNNIRKIAKTGVDYISCGSITHSVKALDISMKNLTLYTENL